MDRPIPTTTGYDLPDDAGGVHVAQVDYRLEPNPGSSDALDQSSGDASNPNPPPAAGAAPWTDQSWHSADAATDATRFRGINTPEQQAALLAGNTPYGYSPEGRSP